MIFTLIDGTRLLLAVAGCAVVLVLPGVTLARLSGFTGRDARADVPTAVVTGLALLPLVDSMVTRFLSLDTALAVNLALAAVGAAAALVGRGVWAWRTKHCALALAWCGLVLFEWVDFDTGQALFQPFTVIDAVKHAAVSEAILQSGAPPHDPFFLRPAPVGYYYFFYTLAALVQRLSLGLVDARAAVGGLVVWTGIGIFGLVRLTLARAGFERAAERTGLVVAVLAAGGLDIVAVLRLGLVQHRWLADPVAWNEQIAGWTESLLWVPHHLAGLIASGVGLLALAAAADPAPAERVGARVARNTGLAGACFASAFGLSLWVALGLAATLAMWTVALAGERRWRAAGLLLAAGVLAALLALPQIHDVLANRAPGTTAPVVLAVRDFSPLDGILPAGGWAQLARFLALPLNYFAAFGLLASGSIAYWRSREASPAPGRDVRRILALMAAAGLLLGAVLRSTLFNNDLGWRVTLLPLLAGTVWTLAALDRCLASAGADTARSSFGQPWRRVPGFLLTLAVLGWATTLYGLVGLRLYPVYPIEPDQRFMAAHPATERALRVAYGWADRHLPPRAVLQHDPTRPRAFAFALYGQRRTAVADAYGSLFGADEGAVRARVAVLAPIFHVSVPLAGVRAAAETAGVDAIIVTDADPVWSMPGSFVWRARPVYASDRVRILLVADLDRVAVALP